MQVRIIGAPDEVRPGATFLVDDGQMFISGATITTLALKQGAEVKFTDNGEKVTIESLTGVAIESSGLAL
jgi:hypothetical protein